MKNLKSMIDAMTDQELDNPELIKGVARDRIAKTAGKVY